MLNSIKVLSVKQTIGQHIRMLRKNGGLTQAQLAEILGLSRLTIVKVEAGENFKIDTMLLILQYFGELAILNEFFKESTKQLTAVKSLY